MQNERVNLLINVQFREYIYKCVCKYKLIKLKLAAKQVNSFK